MLATGLIVAGCSAPTAYSGIPLTVDLRQAEALYQFAASGTGKRIWVSLPSVNGRAGRTVPVETGELDTGLVEARLRLRRLRRFETNRDGNRVAGLAQP